MTRTLDPADRAAGLPGWLLAGLDAVLCVVLGFSLTAIPLAMLGAFRPALALAATVVVSAGLAAVLFRDGRARSARGTPVALAALAVGLLAALLNAHYASEHVIADRDPGIYLWFGRWLSDRGSLLLDNPGALFSSVPGSFVAQCPVTCAGAPGGHLYVQFLHLPSALFAAGAWIGGNSLMVAVNAILGGLSLVVFYAFATRLVRPLFALLATVALAVNLVEVYFTRDSWSEILTQLLLFAGLFMLDRASERPPAVVAGLLDRGSGSERRAAGAGLRDRTSGTGPRAAVAGLLVGAGCMARIDAFVPVLALSAFAVAKRRWSFAAGMAVPGAIGAVDLFVFSRSYYRLESNQLHVLAGAEVLVVVVALLASRRDWPVHRFASGVAAAVVAAALLAWVLRPLLHAHGPANPVIANLQRHNGLPVDATRTYTEDTLRWLGWYLGPVALAAGVVGFALALRDSLRGRLPGAVPFLAVLGLVSALYVVQPSAFPDQIVAARRFLPITIPGLLLCAAWTAQRCADWLRARARLRTAAVGALAVGFVAIPAQQTARIADVREQAGGLRAMARICASLPPRAVVWTIAGHVGSSMIGPVHAFCRVPAGQAPPRVDPATTRAFALRLARRGRRLVLVSSSRPALAAALGSDPGPAAVVLSYRRLEQTLTRRPSVRRHVRIAFWVATL